MSSLELGRTNVWLDCDPGIDDAFAIILAAFSPKINLIGISTVSGNSSIKSMTKNTLKVLNLIGMVKNVEKPIAPNAKLSLDDHLNIGGLKIPVIEGCGRPFLGKPINSDHM